MARPRSFVVQVALVLAGCGGGGGGPVPDNRDGPGDSARPDVLDLPPDPRADPSGDALEVAEAQELADTPADLTLTDAPDFAPADPDTGGEAADAPPETVVRRFTFKVVAGISMGANAVTIAAHHPDRFDAVGSMGGYVDYRYLTYMVTHFFTGGFCPRETILANLAHINDPDWPGSFCGPVTPTMPWEWDDWSFNHFHYDDSGFKSGRNFLFEVLGGFMMAFGNLLYYNPQHPLLPPGVSPEWLINEPHPCESPQVVFKPYNYNAEYNPDGAYPLITFCDGDTVECDDSDPACWKAKGTYEPDKPHTIPIRFLLAVDFNDNRRRDYGEPVVINAFERWRDVGADGCDNASEDGQGGCLAAPRGAPSGDPNHDDYDLLDNPGGTENDFEFQDGEPYDDWGLDGVPDTGDHGEANGRYDRNPRLQAVLDEGDARTFLRQAPLDTITRLTWWFDGGIRDALHAVPCTMQQWNALRLRGLPVRSYDDFGSTPTSIAPGVSCDEFLDVLDDLDYSSAAMGRYVMLRYGDPNASPALIQQGSGKHVGLACEIVNRALLFYTMAAFRMPDPILVADGDTEGRIVNTSYYSEAVHNRVRYSVSLPPGYDAPENADLRYPVQVFLPGHGMAAADMVQTGIIFNILMGQGRIPRFILLAPEGQCCYYQKSTGKRLCGCGDAQSGPGMDCLDPDCRGPHETCEVYRNIPGSDLEQECPSGHFFVNHVTDRWGHLDAADVMRFEDSLMELLDVVDQEYRTRPPEDVEVPAGF